MAHNSAGFSNQRVSDAGKYRTIYSGRIRTCGGIDEVIIKVKIGSHDDNLFTNQSIVGKPTSDYTNKIVIELEFYNYLLQPLSPNVLTTNVVVPAGNEFEVDETPAVHEIGTIGETRYRGRWYIEEGKLKVLSLNAGSELITSVKYWNLSGLTTSERIYSKFKFM